MSYGRKRPFSLLRGGLLLVLVTASCCNALPSPKPSNTGLTSIPQPISSETVLPTPPDISEQPETNTLEKAKSTKLQNVQTRTISALAMLGALFAFVKLTGWTQLILFFQAAMYSEATTVAGVSSSPILKWGIGLVYLFAMDGRLLLASSDALSKVYTYLPLATFGLLAVGLVSWIARLNAPKNDIFAFQRSLSEVAACNLSGIILVGFTSFWIRTLQDYGVPWLAYPALLVIVNDTLAYVFGMLLGRNPLLPTISPKKTWEGFLGALVSTLIVANPLYRLLFLRSKEGGGGTVPMKLCLCMAAYISIIAPFGGFLASVVKRSYGFKDFGSLFPGHGGFVDRLDCQVVTAPFVYLLLQAFGVETTTVAATEGA